MPGAQVRFRNRFKGLMGAAAGQIGAVVVRLAGDDGTVPIEYAQSIRRQAREIVGRVFGGREALRSNGVPISPYARALMEEIGRMTFEIVAAHGAYLRRTLPDDVLAWLLRTPSAEMMAEQDEDLAARFPSLTEEELAMVRDLRIFRHNRWAEYEPAHTWVDPNGYRLSDRIWRTDEETRRKIDLLLGDMIEGGYGAVEIARRVEQFLIPGRELVQTNRPYGTNGSYDAMRLARTEIARAGNQAAYISAYLNPYVGGIDIARSANGDRMCMICPQHATLGFGGERLRDAYDVDNGNIPPYHPHDMCYVLPVVRDNHSVVTQRLRNMLERSREVNLRPVMTPVQIEGINQRLLGEALWAIVKQVLPAQPRLF
jgi:hypothetical protein